MSRLSKHRASLSLLAGGLTAAASFQGLTRLNFNWTSCGVQAAERTPRWSSRGSTLRIWQSNLPVRTGAGLFRHAQPEPSDERPNSSREARAVWLGAAAKFLASLLIGTLAGAPYTISGDKNQPAGPNLFWSFWVRLPIVLAGGYFAYPSLCHFACKHFTASDPLFDVISSLFAPIVSLIYAIIAGQVVVSLWSRLYTVRTLLNREIAALELLERRLQPYNNTAAIRLFSEHLVGIDRYAIQMGTLAPNSYNKLADLAVLPALREDSSIQDVIDNLADLRAERRANVEIGYPRTLWGTLRVCGIILVGCFVILTQRLGTASTEAQLGVRIIFCIFLLTVFWVNHLCRDLASLNRGEFQIDADLIRANTALGKMQRRATLFLGQQ